MKTRMMAFLLALVVMAYAGAAQAETANAASGSGMAAMAEAPGGAQGSMGMEQITPVDKLTLAVSPKYPVGAQVVIETDHMPGMQGATGIVSGAFNTTVYAVDYTTADGTPVVNHRWVIAEEIENSAGKTFVVGDTVTLAMGHMESLGGAGLSAVIVQVVEGPVYMVDYDPTDGSARVVNHQWVTESELRSAASQPATAQSVPAETPAAGNKLASGMPGYRIYTANEDEATVSVIDSATMQVVQTVPVGQGPHNVQVSPDGQYVFVVESNSNTLSAINTTTNIVTNTFAVGQGAAHVVISPDFSKAYVTVAEMIEDAGMDMSGNQTSGNVYVIDLQSGNLAAKIPVGRMPHGLRLSDDGVLFVADMDSNQVSVINAQSNQAVKAINVGNKPVQVAITPDNKYVFVTLNDDGKVAVIDKATLTVINTIPVGKNPIQLYSTPDSKFVYVANTGSADISVIDTATMSVTKTIPAGEKAHGVAVSKDGKIVAVTNTASNDVTVIDTSTNEVIGTVPVGKGPNGVTIMEVGK